MWTDKYGYIVTRLPGERRLRKAHRVVVEAETGRDLMPWEHVHHINGDRTDNRIENLEVIDGSKHLRLHTLGSKRPWQERHLPERAVEDYASGMNLAQIAAKYGVCIPTARNRLVEMGAVMRPPAHKRVGRVV